MSESEISIDFLGRFRNKALSEEFIIFWTIKRSRLSFAAATILVFSWTIVETIGTTWIYSNLHGDDQVANVFYGVSSLFLSIISLSICAILFFSLFNFKNIFIYSYLQLVLIFSMNLIFILKAIKHVQLGSPCSPYITSEPSENHCTNEETFLYMFNYRSVFTMCYSFQLLTAILYEPRLYIVLGCQITTSAVLLYSTYTTLATNLPAIAGFLIIGLVLVELHFQRIKGFINKRKLRQLLEENERNADANHAMEMRHMIGNVAHDLKTPLASFTNGLDMILEILMSAHKKMKIAHLEEKSLTPDMFSECFSSIQTCVTNIRNSNTFMLMTINRCIDYTKASKGMKLVPKYETVDLREALRFPIECMSNIQERINIKVEALSEEICSHIITDKQWLQENLLCLLSNAVKYSTEGNVTIKGRLSPIIKEVESKTVSLFTISSTSHSNKIIPIADDTDIEEREISEKVDCLMFEVEDSGIGLSEEAMKNLFNPFKQAQRLAGGTGLGLYSLAKRMEALKGQYGVRKREDGKQGSLFWFSIPYKPDPVVAAASKFSSHEGSHEASRSISIQGNKIKPQLVSKPSSQLFQGKRMRGGKVCKALEILIVDDAPSILKMSSLMLKRQGHEIWTAENGEIALKRIEEKWRLSGKGFDLVLMDLQMPVMDGLEATRRLRMMEAEGREWMRYDVLKKDEKNEVMVKGRSRQLIIGLSANSDHETAEEALTAGVDDFFGKPFSSEAFNKAISKYDFSN